MQKLTLKILTDPSKNTLTFSKNFRIFSTQEPITNIIKISDFLEDLIISSNSIDLNNLIRSIRYSRNNEDWSLWYSISPNNLLDSNDILFDEKSSYYFEIKYEYDDGTFDELISPIQINEIKIRFEKAKEELPNVYSPVIFCSDEKCSTIIAERNPSFKPYEVDNVIPIYKEMSFFTNKIFGHQVVYFRTLPELEGADYVFKEWTLYKNVDRKCIKVVVPRNTFPSNAPKFTDYGIDFQLPFEVHIDHRYFQSIFGIGSEPRYRDFLYFPLINKMFQVQGSYLHRGFMMEPIYWKVSLKKFNPNIDLLLQDETRHFLDNVINSYEELFEKQVENDIKDSTMKSQYSKITTTFDSSRKSIHPDLKLRPIKFTFNFASLMDNYYDISNISLNELVYEILNDSPIQSTSIEYVELESLDPNKINKNKVILAYQNSEPFIAWKNNSLITTDKNINLSNEYYIKIRGPFDFIQNHEGQSEPGRYIRIESYKDLSFNQQKDILLDNINGKDVVRFKSKSAAVVYNANAKFNKSDLSNLSFTCLFKIPNNATQLNFIRAYDNEVQKGLDIYGSFFKYSNDSEYGDLTISVKINNTIKTELIADFKIDTWTALIISMSNEFKQFGIYLYDIIEDPADSINHIDFKQKYKNYSSISEEEFDIDQKYYIPTSNIHISNIRLFKTMIKEDQHDFILSQQYIKDESMLILIDNCKPQLNIPYVGKNR